MTEARLIDHIERESCSEGMLEWTTTYCVDRSQREGEVEVVAVVDVSVLHEPQIFISHHLRGTGQDISEDFFLPSATENTAVASLFLT